MNAPFRPALRYMGGKWRLAPKIIPFLPPHRTYVEPFGGAASVLLRKPAAFQEIYNDLDGEIVGLFRVLRDPAGAAELSRLIALTPWAREEFEASYTVSPDPIENARRTVVRSFMGFGSTATALRRKTGFRAISVRNGKHPAKDFSGMPQAILALAERMRGVVIENRPALEILTRCDAGDTLAYLDPPYVHSTRSGKRIHGGLEHAYAHEMDEEQHRDLLAWCSSSKSMVVISGYATDLYEQALTGWTRIELAAFADGARARTEVLWINPAAVEANRGLFHD